ncbi:FeS cluster assembly protein sufD [Candidatus Blochmanniella vafra str. BVAF]|uniref:FeS cluster assembly protein sufD n=1 Tax=Blochmanniella vafra (strain BVAF) TaxID=859654 RepID=E8Q664_BLOVB|nr:FeS cluster assembly protein SufD [Candidatus Blochmannia vafer]ADV33758.1 FeS cluster assembly protein sufD [Candidatus Blochmannia vafer str. BVAF]
MVGYVKDSKTQILRQWYLLFKQQHNNCLSNADIKHWEFVKKYKATDNTYNLNNFNFFENLSKYHFIINSNLNIDICLYNSIKLPIDCYRVVFINGQFSFKFSDKIIDPWILTIHQGSKRYNIFNPPICPTMFSYLTECLSDTTIHIKLPKSIETKKPLYLLHINSGTKIPNQLSLSNSHYYLETEQYTNTSIIEHFVGINENSYLFNTRSSILIGKQSKLNHISLIYENQSSYHISNQDININSCAHANSNVFIISGSKFTSHQINSKINHSQSFLSLNSLTILLNKEIGKIQTYVEHNNQNHATSEQLHKIIANDHSTGVFQGLIKVNKNSIKTDSKMTNNNLLLNKSASVYSKPKLEIYSDSVQCGHGATVGCIDMNHVFYLNTRGIVKKDAINMLIYAFTIEITKNITHPFLQDVTTQKINHILSGM